MQWPTRGIPVKPEIRERVGKFYSRSHDVVIRVYDEAGNVLERHEYNGDFKEW